MTKSQAWAEIRREAIAEKKHAKRYGVWYSRRYLRKFEQRLNLAENRNILVGIPF
jgi:hypothetical protein